jgi:hypothetical protein
MVMTTEPTTRVCLECGAAFTIDAGELAFLEAKAALNPYAPPWRLPKRCTPCRMARRRERETVTAGEPITLRCANCGEDFPFGSRDRQFYAERAYRYPRRCPACRTTR